MNMFTGTQNRIESFFSDDSKEIKAACEMKGALHDTGQPHRSETNGVSERAVQKVKQGTACVHGQSGWLEPMLNWLRRLARRAIRPLARLARPRSP